MSNTELKVEFWKELWVDLINNFLKRSYGFNLYSPQILVEDIIVEIEENKFKNLDNKRYFSLKLKEYLDNDEVINSILKSEFSLLQKAIHTTKNEYVLSLCKQIKSTLIKGVYYKHTLELIQNIINSDTEIDIDFVNKINYYSQSLIVEFIKKTYVLKDIENFITNIFDSYSYRESSNLLNTDFPHQVNYDEYKTKDGEGDNDSYKQAIKEKIDNLTLKDRIKTLNYYYNKKTEKVDYVFVIRGLKSGVNMEKTVLGVTFYTLDKKKSNNKTRLWEDLQWNNETDEKFIQAKVEVDYLLPYSSYTIAMRKLETTIDILYCYFKFKIPLSHTEFGYCVYDKNGQLKFSRTGGELPNRNSHYFNSLDISESERHLGDIEKYSFLWNDDNTNNEALSKIKNALRWHRKAEQSTRDEDKILNYWIALETLFNTKNDIISNIFENPKNGKVQLIQEIIASRQVLNFVYDYGWELYWYYKNKRASIFQKSDLPEELRKKAQLNVESGETIYLKNFIDQISEIKKYEKNLFIIEKLNSVEKFYNDLKYTKSIIDENITNIKNDILMIYRLRNLIVHNAHYDNTLLPYYSWKVKTYCGGLLRKFIQEFKNEKTLSTIIFDIYINKEKYLIDLDNGNVNLFENE